MKKIIVIGICLVLIGGLIMPAQAYNFTIYLDEPKDGTNASFYLEGKLVGKADKNGKCVFCIDHLERHKKYNVTVKKEGFRDMIIEVYNAGCDNGVRCAYSNYYNAGIPRCDSGVRNGARCSFCHEGYHIQPTPEPTHGPVTPVPAPTVTPLPEGYKSPEQRISELENITAGQEQKIAENRSLIDKIIAWIKDKFGDIIK